uniref:GAG-pre-integrase domain-containing protein n=1 Tax=Coccidioides posadasii RMSCC 3488 TaxID=454284 RepID=A0A0J6FPF1_COCPO|nr:hypothetical protein CPAG_08545 [Coccidioides posadasii RMSCC 3488]
MGNGIPSLSRIPAFQLKSSENEYLYAGSNNIKVEGLGLVWIKIQTPRGPEKIGLSKTAYIPNFHTNLVAMPLLWEKKIYFDNRKMLLMRDNEILANLELKHCKVVVEWNPPDISELWHQRLGHLGRGPLKHLPYAVTGIKAKDLKGPAGTECEPCAVTKSCQIIS